MPDRFGLDIDGNNIQDLNNTAVYVQNNQVGETDPKFTVIVQGSSTLEDSSVPTWEICGRGMTEPIVKTGWNFSHDLPEGSYQLTMKIDYTFLDTRRTSIYTNELLVEDILIVSMGDSFSSGEGNPERSEAKNDNEKWAVAGNGPVNGPSSELNFVNADHKRSHRSTVAWPAQAALMIERASRKSSVTFVSVAASGASVDEGILGSYKGIDSEDLSNELPTMPSQIKQIKELVGWRTIDALTLTIGVNDVGFGNILAALIAHDEGTCVICGPSYSEIETSFKTGEWNDITIFDELVRVQEDVAGLNRLDNLYDDISEKINSDLKFKNLYIMPYPDPTTAGATCESLMDDITSLGNISREEANWAWANIVNPLNDEIKSAALRNGWIYSDYGSGEFRAHGECGSNPYGLLGVYRRNPFPDLPGNTSDGDRWFRTATESMIIQGGNSLQETKGTMHPNEFGHKAVGKDLHDHIFIDGTGIGINDNDDQISEAITWWGYYSPAIFFESSIWPRTDVDMFPVSLIGGWKIKIVIESDDGLDHQIRIFNSQGREVKRTAQMESEYNIPPTANATHYIGISAYGNRSYNQFTGHADGPGNSVGDFSIRIEYIGDAVPNNISNAKPLILDVWDYNVDIDSEGDVDMFSLFGITSNTVLSFTVFPGDLDNVRIRIFDVNGNELTSNLNSLNYHFITDGDYFLGLSSAGAETYDANVGTTSGGDVGRFKIRIQYGPDSDDQFSEASINPLTPGSIVTGYGLNPYNEVDMYEIDLVVGQTLSINVIATAELRTYDTEPAWRLDPDLNLAIRVFNSAKSEMILRAGSLVWTVPATGEYYIGISNGSIINYNATAGSSHSGRGIIKYYISISN